MGLSGWGIRRLLTKRLLPASANTQWIVGYLLACMKAKHKKVVTINAN